MKKITISLVLFLVASLCVAYTMRVVQTGTSPDGNWFVELSDYHTETDFEIRSRPIPTSNWRKVGSNLKSDYDVASFLISKDSTRVVYIEGRTATGVWELFSAPVSGGPGVRISQPMPLGGGVEMSNPRPELWGDKWVRYYADAEVDERYEWWVTYVVPQNPTVLPKRWIVFKDGFETGDTLKWALP